jgi:hypothetical protein
LIKQLKEVVQKRLEEKDEENYDVVGEKEYSDYSTSYYMFLLAMLQKQPSLLACESATTTGNVIARPRRSCLESRLSQFLGVNPFSRLPALLDWVNKWLYELVSILGSRRATLGKRRTGHSYSAAMSAPKRDDVRRAGFTA